MEYERREISEKELEDMIRQFPHLIEEGLRYVTRQRKTLRGSLDVLLVDSDNTLVVAELKTEENDEMLMQALDYYDFVSENMEGLARIYKEFDISPERMPRLMLMAPSFSPRLVNRCKWVKEDVQISLCTYQYIVLKGEAKGASLIFNPIELPRKIERPAKPTPRDEQLNRIKDVDIRELSRRFLNDVKNLDLKNVSLDDRQWLVSIKVKGTVCAYWEPRQKFVRVCTYNEDGNWQGFNFKTQQEYERCLNLVKTNYERIMKGEFQR